MSVSREWHVLTNIHCWGIYIAVQLGMAARHDPDLEAPWQHGSELNDLAGGSQPAQF